MHWRTQTHTVTDIQGPCWDHTASITWFLSSSPIDYCYILWLDLITPDYISVFLPCSLAPSLTHPLIPFFHTPHHPSCVCLSLAFISPAYWTPPLASKCDALMVWPLLGINPYLPPLQISMLTNDLKCLPFLGYNKMYYKSYSLLTDLLMALCGTRETPEVFNNSFRFRFSLAFD